MPGQPVSSTAVQGRSRSCRAVHAGTLRANGFYEAVVKRLLRRLECSRQVEIMRVYVVNRKERVPRQFALNTNDKLLIVSLVDRLRQLVNLGIAENRRAIEKCWTKPNRWQPWQRICVPLTQAGNLGAGRRANRDNAIQVVPVVYCDLVNAVFKGTSIQPVPRGTAEHHSLAV